MSHFNKILIANRGEIAARIIRTANDLGYPTVAVYSDSDANALHVQLANQAVYIGSAPVTESYLVIEYLIDAAKRSDADAIHPGYGLLSENADFATACQQNGIVFIGPSPEAIKLMGSKRLSKIAMLDADIPCIPGYQGKEQSHQRLLQEAKKIGFPVMLKASAGGGGRGMRLVTQQHDLAAMIDTARSEAKSTFGDSELIVEKALREPRHIEIQIFADRQGNTLYLGERDCSIQRRHQKIVEEAPSPFVDPSLRAAMGETAVNVAKACRYEGAGTVEFLVDRDKHFYFLEMNTRLQVEHPVTELTTGLDLVAWQLKVAAGEPLPLTQADIKLCGHAIEARLYAEDPRNNFIPQTGQVLVWQAPKGQGIRVDHGVCTDQSISAFYDPLLAKIIAYGSDREEARRRLSLAVNNTVLLGINNNKRFLADILIHQTFVNGAATTRFIEDQCTSNASTQPAASNFRELALAAIIIHTLNACRHTDRLANWSNAQSAPYHYKLRSNNEDYLITLSATETVIGRHYQVQWQQETIEFDILSIDKQRCCYIHNGVRQTMYFFHQGDRIFIDGEFGNRCIVDQTHATLVKNNSVGTGKIKAPMDGTVVDVLVRQGQNVEKGNTLLIIEAMKMEHSLNTDLSGIVSRLTVKPGDQVTGQQLLACISTDA